MKCARCPAKAVMVYEEQHPSDQTQMVKLYLCSVHALLEKNEIAYETEHLLRRIPKRWRDKS